MLKKIALLAGVVPLGSCVPYLLVLPVPGPIVLNHPYQCKVLEEGPLTPVADVRVRVQIFQADRLKSDYELRSDADGIFHIPRQTEPGILILWVAGLIGPTGKDTENMSRAGGGSGQDTRIVLTLTREGFASKTLSCVEKPREGFHHPRGYVPNVIWLKPEDE